MINLSMTHFVAKPPWGFSFLFCFFFNSFLFFNYILITVGFNKEIQDPLHFHWNSQQYNTNILYFLWNNIVLSNNKKEGSNIILNLYLKLSKKVNP